MPNKTMCIYHANCVDGFTAAWVVFLALGSAVDYIPASYGDPLPEVDGCDVIVVDFSYKRKEMLELGERANSVLVLDHHRSAADDLKGFPSPLPVVGNQEPWFAHLDGADMSAYTHGVACLFDMERSGAQIAWDFFQARMPRPQLVNYVADRDLWRFGMLASREISAWLGNQEQSFSHWITCQNILEDSRLFAKAVEAGREISVARGRMITDAVTASRGEMLIAGIVVPSANVPFNMASEAGNILAADAPFAATYFDLPCGKSKFSLRSRPDGMDVQKIAKRYGGGGHVYAAGIISDKDELQLRETTPETSKT